MPVEALMMLKLNIKISVTQNKSETMIQREDMKDLIIYRKLHKAVYSFFWYFVRKISANNLNLISTSLTLIAGTNTDIFHTNLV